MNRLATRYLRTGMLLIILATALSSLQAGPYLTAVLTLTDSIPKPLPEESLKENPPPIPSPPPIRKEVKEFIGSIREKMPLFPGCDKELVYPQDKKCADSLFLEFIYGNLRYPYIAWRDSVEGMAVISFNVEKDGAVTETKILRDPGAGTGAEALRLINLMVDQNLRWTPGEQAGKPVRVRYNMPVKFKLTENTVPFPPPPPLPTICAEPFRIVEQMPRFPGCEHLTDKQERKTCADKKLIEYLHANLKLTPLQVRSCGVIGTAVIQFVVETDGTITDTKIMRDIGVGYGQTALKAVESMNENGIRWIPGRQRGQAVRVQYNVPVKIHLE